MTAAECTTPRKGSPVSSAAATRALELDPADAFRFNLDRYQSQLVAGYSRSLSSGGLEVFMRDVDKLGKKLEVRSVQDH